jgi:hypothetical protein
MKWRLLREGQVRPGEIDRVSGTHKLGAVEEGLVRSQK